MADILARSPNLDDVIRKAANRLGDNHGLTRDTHGMRVDNEGNTSRYVGSHGQHPSKSSQPQTSVRQGWHRTLNEVETTGSGKHATLKGYHTHDHSEEFKEDSGREESDNYGKDMGQDDKELKDLKHDALTGYHDHDHIEDLEDDIHYDDEHDDGIDEEELGEIENQVRKKIRKGLKGWMEEEDEMGEATGAASAGGYVGPIFGEVTESIIREEISKKVSKQQLKESLKNRLTRNVLNEKDYFEGKLKYEKPTKSPGASKNTPGVKETESTLKKSKKDNKEYLKQFDKKIKEYLDFEGNSNPEFPHQNNSKTDYKSPMYRNSTEDQEFIDDFRGMGLQDANGVENLDRIDDYLNGSSKTGNSQDAANVVPSKLGKKMKKTMKSKKKKIAARKAKMTNLRGMTPDVQTVTKESAPNVYIVEQQKEMDKIKHLFNYTDTTQ